MNFGRGIPNARENGNGNVQERDSWLLATPEKVSSVRSVPAPVEMEGNQLGIGNWEELIGMYSDILNDDITVQASNPVSGVSGEIASENGVASETNQLVNRNNDSYVPYVSNGSAVTRTNSLAELLGIKNTESVASANGTWNKSMNVSNRPKNSSSISNSYTQVASNRMGSEYSSLMLTKQNCNLVSNHKLATCNAYTQVTSNWSAPESTCLTPVKQNCTLGSNQRLANVNSYYQVAGKWTESESTSLMLAKQDCSLGSNQRLTDSSLTQLTDDGYPIPYWPNYNLNSPPRPEPETALSVTSSLSFAPVTPDQAKQLERQRDSERLNGSLDESSSQEKDKQWNVVTSTSGEIENHPNDLSQVIADSASGVFSTPHKEMNVLYNEGEQGIDLNKTPEQKTPKRRKHRPKVVIEGKQKRVRKDATPKTNDSCDNQSGKRKYVRKKSLKTPESQQEKANESPLPTVEASQKSCRRALNFDLDTSTRDASHDIADSHQVGRNEGSKRPFNLNLNSDEADLCAGINNIPETSTAQVAQGRQQNNYIENNLKTVSTCNLTSSTNQMPSKFISWTEQSAPAKPPVKANDRTLNVIARNLSMRNVIPGKSSWREGYNQLHQQTRGEEISKDVSGTDSLTENFHRTRQLMLQNTTQLVVKDTAIAHDKRGLKRGHCHIVEHRKPPTQNLMPSPPILSQGNLYVGNQHGRNNVGAIASEAHKKMSTNGVLDATIVSTPSSTRAARDCPKQVEAGYLCAMYANSGTANMTGRLLNYRFERDNVSKNLSNTAVNGPYGDWSIVPVTTTQSSQWHQGSFIGQANRGQMEDRVYQPKATKINCQQGIKISDPNMQTNDQKKDPGSLNLGSRKTKEVLQQQNDALQGYRRPPLKSRGKQRKQQLPDSVDEITYLLECLHISDIVQEQNALVPYKGSSSIVPYEGFDPIKKRKPRPKVDLDPETDRIWKLLMGSEGSESTEAADKDKEKWWEEERKVFRGRADSFIARMHLVQGDRRFSRWKGSVVDSVIGVFLTQNVSDHLSSSAFMSLAAKFPLQSHQKGTGVLVEKPDIQVVESNGSIEIFSSRRMSAEESGYTRTLNAEFHLPQHSLAPLGFQTSKEIISSAKSTSNAEERAGFNPNTNYNIPKKGLQAEGTVPTDFHSHVNGSSLLDERSIQWHQQLDDPRFGTFSTVRRFSSFPDSINSQIHETETILSSRNFQLNSTPGLEVENRYYFELPGGDNISSSVPTPSGITNMKSVNHMSGYPGKTSENNTAQQNGVQMVKAPMLDQFAFLGKHPAQQGYLHPERFPGYDLQSTNSSKLERNKNFHLERTIVTQPVGPAVVEQESTSRQDKQKCLDNKVEANAKEQMSSLKTVNGTGTNVPHAKKGKAEGEKKNTFDWDSLRKQVQSNGRKERSKETMDSLDYEALRCADVSEISNAIKERGMNNMLAERIKDFLNRLVTDHGSVDLEWLRDVPPDKAKDYLLSFRGLGLKSVECVRLLTLHQLAFPVDTNVGRIAVRLGWVPLQPLPESLQLHLLELYPILESIQKYLWPRLCKLDQQTLYELHYQMITFGKVFCTKSKPNCNACPMRGECRHFASAFASARLALPGPEERSIVSSAVPIQNDNIPVTSIKPVPLLESEKDSSVEAAMISKRCEPIVEEPATPERETTEILESDIEDAYYEDPDEIPTIKLNIEEFTLNLQNYMQNNMELQEGDMSRALVALDPEVASIPTPKLKNVSRLRTEHQVYELPDSHPLLKGLDKREPDDPSPYLLAIWTPGETANSIQPPESRCEMHEAGQLCNDTTCFSCNSTREANSQTVRGTLLIPCRTAMRGSFPLNGTYFQVNEMFADHESSLNPIDVPRSLIWNLPRRTVYFGTSVTSIFKGLPTEGIQFCFWKGFVCVRGFDQKQRAPRPLMARLHFPASKLVKTKK